MQKQRGRERAKKMTKKSTRRKYSYALPHQFAAAGPHRADAEAPWVSFCCFQWIWMVDPGRNQVTAGGECLLSSKLQFTYGPKQSWSTWVSSSGGCPTHGTASPCLPAPPQPSLPPRGAKGRPSLPPHVPPAQCHPPGPQPTLCTTTGPTCPPEPRSYPDAPGARGDPDPATRPRHLRMLCIGLRGPLPPRAGLMQQPKDRFQQWLRKYTRINHWELIVLCSSHSYLQQE